MSTLTNTDRDAGCRIGPLQLLLACTVLLPFTAVIGLAWLCQMGHARVEAKALASKAINACSGEQVAGNDPSLRLSLTLSQANVPFTLSATV